MQLPLRQIHLDFHTSPHILDVGSDFDPQVFVQTLADAHVQSINVFARCHHGLCYYPSKIAKPHPSLKRDLLGEMIEACHKRGIKAPIYISVGWDEETAKLHPEWRQVDIKGAFVGKQPFSGAWGWQYLCLNSPYRDFLLALTEEICRLYPVDGMWFDITRQTRPGCSCTYCQDSMWSQGLNPALEKHQFQHSLQIEREFMKQFRHHIQSFHPNALVYFNGNLRLDPDPVFGLRTEATACTHWDIESLPSGLEGYSHFPMYARHLQTLGLPIAGMNARFHLSWADFGGIKNLPALEYECFRHLAFGAACIVGDQLHPRGSLEKPAYERIAHVFSQVEACEPWCINTQPCVDIGLLMPRRQPGNTRSKFQDILEGAMRMLTELGHQFQILDYETDLSPYRLIVMPDEVIMNEALADKINHYVRQGGALLMSDRSGLSADGLKFAIDAPGLIYLGAAPFSIEKEYPSDPTLDRDGIMRDFLWQPHCMYFHIPPGESSPIFRDIPAMDHIMYELGSRVQPMDGTQTLVQEMSGYFDRSWDHFCSHRQTPPATLTGFPMVTFNNRVIYFSSPIFRSYMYYGSQVYKLLVRNAIDILLPQPLVRSGLPSGGEVTLHRQKTTNGIHRLVCHLLFYTPQRRARHLDIIEDVIPLYNIPLSIRAEITPSRVYLAPQEQELEYHVRDGRIECEVPLLRGHQLVVIE